MKKKEKKEKAKEIKERFSKEEKKIRESARIEAGKIMKNEIKSYIAKSGKTLVEIITEFNKKHQNDTQYKEIKPANFSNKLSRGSFSYQEIKEIAEACGYSIEWIKK